MGYGHFAGIHRSKSLWRLGLGLLRKPEPALQVWVMATLQVQVMTAFQVQFMSMRIDLIDIYRAHEGEILEAFWKSLYLYAIFAAMLVQVMTTNNPSGCLFPVPLSFWKSQDLGKGALLQRRPERLLRWEFITCLRDKVSKKKVRFKKKGREIRDKR